jgi:NADH-quinone oxidoreductase subunit N
MTSADFVALLPLVCVGGAAVLVMLATAVRRRHGAAAALAVAGLAAGLIALPLACAEAPRSVTALVVIDRFALFYMGLVFAAATAVALLSYGYLACRECRREEFYILLLLATFGSAVLAAANHFASFILGLEILSVSLYGLIAYVPARTRSVEAGLKYLVLAGTSSAFLLLGMALVYAYSGTMELPCLGGVLASGNIVFSSAGAPMLAFPALVLAGFVLMFVGIGFKLGVVPFHLWTPDVYEGAPAPVTAFVATASKGAVFALVLRLLAQVDAHRSEQIVLVVAVIAIASMGAGNLLALLQDNVKRMLAYSSIAHLGYLLVALLASGERGVAAATFYLAAYFVTTLGAFGVITVLSGPAGEAERLEDYRGLARRRPVVAGVFTAMLLSLAGIPLTAGFIGKFFILSAGVGATLWVLVLVMAAASVVGLFYYLRVVIEMYKQPDFEAGSAPAPEPAAGAAGHPPLAAGASIASAPLSFIGGAVLAVLVLAVVWLGVFPARLLTLIDSVAAAFVQ